MTPLDKLENDSIAILREAHATMRPLAMLWSAGKDSCVMAHLARKAFFGALPFPVVHLDTGAEFPEVYVFRDRLVEEWGLRLIADAAPPLEEIDPTLPPASRFAARKTAALQELTHRYGFKGIFAGIRRDEQATRAKERVFSPRGGGNAWEFTRQPPEFFGQYNTEPPAGGHLRIHPLLAWTELDIWRYIQREELPVVPLYFAKDGQRYRSLGEIGITHPIASHVATIEDIIAELSAIQTDERAGRSMDHESEDAFERLRAAGYM